MELYLPISYSYLFADKLGNKNQNKKIESALCTEAVMLIAKKVHPITVRERLNAFIPRKDRKVERIVPKGSLLKTIVLNARLRAYLFGWVRLQTW